MFVIYIIVMSENYALYSTLYEQLPEAQMANLIQADEFSVSETERGLTYLYQWPDLKIIVSEMPEPLITTHLNGLVGYIQETGSQHLRALMPLIECIGKTKLVVGVELVPGVDDEERCEEVLGKLSYGLAPVIFNDSCLFDKELNLILSGDGKLGADYSL